MSGWNRQTDRGGEREGGGRLMERERVGRLKVQWKEKEGGWMRVMEVNGKGVDSLVYGHHKHGPQRSVEEAVEGGAHCSTA